MSTTIAAYCDKCCDAADPRLIRLCPLHASAGLLLEALEAMVILVRNAGLLPVDGKGKRQAVYDRARHAIRVARGGDHA